MQALVCEFKVVLCCVVVSCRSQFESRILQEAVKTDTDGALASIKELGDIVTADQEDMSRQVSHSLALSVITEYIRHLIRYREM